ncbi:LysE family transporter [Ruegeria sp. HKCCD8929]|uniref:LysE family transporter n=1 Tax=Ruegeria sp. HKCCD8929 TaxID=2683006 RepID=UPI0014882FBA|nr:LysE family transporter [Ruegeria sp. HKCCD8929]
MTDLLIPLPVILVGWALAGGSPGPATLAISSTSMAHGRGAGVALATGVVAGSAVWGIAAGLGFSALMMANAWLFELVRIAGAGYLFYLAARSLRSAWVGGTVTPAAAPRRAFFAKGLTLHLTNPKAILAWGSIYAIALAPAAGALSVWSLFAALTSVSITVFIGYALLFSAPPIARAYARAKRWFDLAFGVLFGAASLTLLTARLS